MPKQILSVSAAALLWLLAGIAPAMAAEPAFVTFGLGIFDINDDETTAELRAEYRSDLRLWKIGPMGGVSGNIDGGIYGFGGIFLDIYFGRRFVLTPNFAVGLYGEGDSKDLGDIIEFRSGVELAYRFDDRSRLGVAFHHLSNAGIGDTNPGTETLVLNYSVSLDGIF